MTTTSTKESHAAVAAKLPDSALVLLAHAAQRTDGMVLPQLAPIRARGSALKRLLQRLVRLGLIAEVVINHADQAWRTNEDGTRIGLQITAAGQDAIGIDEAEHRNDSSAIGEGALGPAPQQTAREDAAEAAINEVAPPQVGGDRSPGADRRRRGAGDDQRDGARHDLEEADGEPSLAPTQHRRGSKQALLVEHLSRPQGQSIAELSTILGWQAHTVRAAITGLRKKGYSIARDKNAKGETMYRVTAPCQDSNTPSSASPRDPSQRG